MTARFGDPGRTEPAGPPRALDGARRPPSAAADLAGVRFGPYEIEAVLGEMAADEDERGETEAERPKPSFAVAILPILLPLLLIGLITDVAFHTYEQARKSHPLTGISILHPARLSGGEPAWLMNGNARTFGNSILTAKHHTAGY